MADIQKLAKLTGIHLSADEQKKFEWQINSVVDLLEQVKQYDIEPPTQSWHELIGLQTLPQKNGISDGDTDAILQNIDHTIVGHAIEVKAFVE